LEIDPVLELGRVSNQFQGEAKFASIVAASGPLPNEKPRSPYRAIDAGHPPCRLSTEARLWAGVILFVTRLHIGGG